MNTELETVLSALKSIPSDLSREIWVSIGFAALAGGASVEDLIDWSRPAKNFKSENDVRSTFKNAKAEGGITVNTLFYYAKQFGWTREKALINDYSTQTATIDLGDRLSALPISAKRAEPEEYWARFVPAQDDHPYILRKEGWSSGLRTVPEGDPLVIAGQSMVNALAIPIRSMDGHLHSIQFVTPPSTEERLKASGKSGKLNLPGSKIVGFYEVSYGSNRREIYVVEGIGQAWTCAKASSGLAVVTFGWGNTENVVREIRKKYPDATVVLVLDSGKEQLAQKLATDFELALAPMPTGSPTNSDINDLEKSLGLEKVKEILVDAICRFNALHPLANFINIDFAPKPPKFVIPDLIDHGVVTFAGGHGVGKTSTILPLSMIAAGLHAFDSEFAPKEWRHVVYICEDTTQAQRILSAVVLHSNWGLNENDVRERFHLVEARRLPPNEVVQVGPAYIRNFSRHSRGQIISPLVVIDTNASVLDLEDSNSNSQISRLMSQLKQGFSGLPVWVICHVAKAVRNKSEVTDMSALGGVAFEADSVQNLYLLNDPNTNQRYLSLGKCRFERRWNELEVISKCVEVIAHDEFGDIAKLNLRWNEIQPMEISRREKQRLAYEEQRRRDESELRGKILELTETSLVSGNPLNKEGIKARVGKNRNEVTDCVNRLIHESWLLTVDVPRDMRTNSKRSNFLIPMSAEERNDFLAGKGPPKEKIIIPASWRRPNGPVDSAISS